MRGRFFIPLFVFATIIFVAGMPFHPANARHTVQNENGHGHRDKKKKPKKKKKKKKKTHADKMKKAADTAKMRKQKVKRDREHQKNLDKLKKKKAKKQKAVTKAQDQRKDYVKGCDSTELVRTSQDTLLLKKYETIYRSLGGLCYIIHLQQMAELEKTSDGFYSVRIRASKDPRAPADWQTYLYCPIGKPDGMIALINPLGDTVQLCNYRGEKKEGMMTWVKKGEGVIHQEKYAADVKVWADDPSEQ
ncbi:MAG: hypothetical protein HY064_04210 [Bacteroidetes bacterium]|nr:hypothetical protein [Bacteroidota bacterium]